MGKIRSILEKSEFKSIAVLSSGVILAQMISFLVQPVAARLFGQEDFGIIALIVSLVSIMTPIVTMQYHMSIVNASSDGEADAITKVAILINIFTNILFAAGLFIYNRLNPKTYEQAGGWIYTSIIFLFLSGMTNIIESYNNRYKEYKLMSVQALYRSAAAGVSKIVLGLLRCGFPGLLISQFIGCICGLKRQAQRMIDNRSEIRAVKRAEMIRVARKFSNQPLFSLPGIFISNFSYSILPILLNSLYSTEEVGIYFLGMNMLGIPLNLVTNNVARVFFVNASKEKEDTGKFEVTFKNTFWLLTIISVFGFTLLWFIAEPVFRIVFGTQWEKSGSYVKLLIPLYSVRFVVSALMYGFIISERQLLKCVLQCHFLVQVLCVYLSALKFHYKIEEFLTQISWSYAATYLILLGVLYFSSRGKKRAI